MSSKNELAVRVRLPEGINVKALVRSPDDYSIEVHETLEAAEKDWRRLEQEGECLAFQTYFWIKSWHELVGVKLGVSPRVVVLRTTDGEAAMVIPLGIWRRRGLRYLSFLAHDISDYQGPLMAKGVGERLAGDFATLWSKVLERLPSCRSDRFPAHAGGHGRGAKSFRAARRGETNGARPLGFLAIEVRGVPEASKA